MTEQQIDAEDREVLRRRARDRIAEAEEWNATANPPLVARMSERVQISAGDLLALLDQLDQAEARLKAVRDLHRPYGDTLTGLYVCTACDQPCPCPTTRALEG